MHRVRPLIASDPEPQHVLLGQPDQLSDLLVAHLRRPLRDRDRGQPRRRVGSDGLGNLVAILLGQRGIVHAAQQPVDGQFQGVGFRSGDQFRSPRAFVARALRPAGPGTSPAATYPCRLACHGPYDIRKDFDFVIKSTGEGIKRT